MTVHEQDRQGCRALTAITYHVAYKRLWSHVPVSKFGDVTQCHWSEYTPDQTIP